MKNMPWITSLTAVLFASALLTACGGSSSSNITAETAKGSAADQGISLKFAAQVNSDTLICEGAAEAAAQSIVGKTFSLYISDVEVATTTGDFVSLALTKRSVVDVDKKISLLAFCGLDGNSGPKTNYTIEGTAPSADYSRVRFTIGVPEEYNHLDPDVSGGILSTSINMHWGWTNGYKHARLDTNKGPIHLASTGCATDDTTSLTTCTNSNRPTYTLENVDLVENTIVLDYVDLVTGTGDALNCMSSTSKEDCTHIFANLGLDLASGSCLGDDCDSQTWVRIE